MTEDLHSFDFNKEKARIDAIIADWNGKEKEAIETRRKVRANKRNVAEERAKETILPDETIIPDRTIDNNMRRNRATYINYVAKTKNALYITDINDPDRDTEELERWFTLGMRFPSWNVPWIELQDGMQLNGGVAMEVVYNPEKPFNVELEYISRDCLIFPKRTKNLQACPRLLRKYEVTALQLEEFKQSYGFDESITSKLLEKFDKKEEFIVIYRVLLKTQGIVYNAWYSPDEHSNWLRAPIEHQIGLFDFDEAAIQELLNHPDQATAAEFIQQMAKPLFLKNYPIFWFPLSLEESQIILDIQGRAALDIHEQEAITQMLSATVNAANRAAQLYPSAETEPGGDAKLMELGALKPGRVMNKTITLQQFPWPQPIILEVIQAMDMRKAQAAGGADYAALARKDANKTAREMTLASQESQEQQAVDLSIYCNPYLEVYSLCFLIAKHQALFGLCNPPKDIGLLFGNYSFQASGDVEILRRLEERDNAQKFLELARGTPLAEKLLTFLIDKFFPDQSEEWKELIANDQTQLIAAMLQVIEAAPTDGLTDEQQASLQSLIGAARAVVAGSGNNQVSGVSQTPQNQPA